MYVCVCGRGRGGRESRGVSNFIPFQGELINMKCSLSLGLLFSSVCMMGLGERAEGVPYDVKFSDM